MTRSMLVMTGLLCSIAHAADTGTLNELKAVDVAKTATGAQVVVTGTKAPVFTVFRLNDPDRLVVDLTGASTRAVRGHHDGTGPVTGVVASQFSDARAEVGRVLIGLERATRYDVHADDARLVITIDGETRKPEPVAAAEPQKAEPEQVAQAVAETQPEKKAADAKAQPREDGAVASHLDEKPVAHPAGRLQGVSFAKGGLKLVTDGEVAKFELIQFENPNRLAIDLYGVKGAARAPRVSDPMVKEIRLGAHADKVRVVIEANGAMPTYRAVRKPNGLVVSLTAAALTRADDAEVEIDGKRVAIENASVPVQATAASQVAEVKGVEFAESPEGGRVEIKLSAPTKWRVERPDTRSAVLTLESARIARQLERSLDTSELGTPVKMVSAFSMPGAQNRVRVVVAAEGALEDNVASRAGGLSWRLTLKGAKTEQVLSEARTAGFSTEATEFAQEGAPQRSRYVGKKVSFEFKDIDIHNLLRIIAEISKKNIVVADDVSGKVTVRLRNVPWDQALELVLRSKGLGQEEFGNIVRVAPLGTLEAESKSRADRKKADRLAKDLSVSLVSVNYATATDMASRVKEVLSERGNVTVDGRTNTLIVRDLPENMGKVRQLVAQLDTQTPQVLIEARIVEANTRYAREVGVQWGGSAAVSTGTGNPTGLVFPNSMAFTGGIPTGASAGTSAPPSYAVSLPVGAGDGNGGALGMVFGSAGGALQLNLRLTALEAQGAVKTISSPKVTTLDNATARISQGVSIPFSQTSAAGATTSFMEARLSLEVTPHITQDASVLMAISAQNNQPDPANTGANGQPAIQRKEANTNVLVKDGDTTVIGGIYVRAGSSNQAGLPILSKIPVLGFFFRNHRENETKNELLIFITPRILNRQAVAQSQ